jgi:hypothetical protein
MRGSPKTLLRQAPDQRVSFSPGGFFSSTWILIGFAEGFPGIAALSSSMPS